MKTSSQPSLFRAPAPARKRASSMSRSVTYTQANCEAASVILENVLAYGGEDALPVIWARAVTMSAPKAQGSTN